MSSSVIPIGQVDFNKTCADRFGSKVFPDSGRLVPYFRCKCCGLIYTDYMDSWTDQKFIQEIYNDEYHLSDPVIYRESSDGKRVSVSYAKGIQIATEFNRGTKNIKVLDYGSRGNPGDLGRAMIDLGFSVTSYDPFFADCNIFPASKKFDLTILVEVVEHCADLSELISNLNTVMSDDGALYIATQIHPDEGGHEVLESSYISPRNGHISIFTHKSINTLFARLGLKTYLPITARVHDQELVVGYIGFKSTPKDFMRVNFV